jgi:glutamine amidotransferase
MCELLALSSSLPTRLTFSLRTLAAHGSQQGTTHDGWGVAFYQGDDAAVFREPSAADNSPLVRFLESEGPATELALSHIRRATRGPVSLANTQPFTRELGGQTHVFAHNGDLPGIEKISALSLERNHPVGQTDSEYAFCALMARMGSLWAPAYLPCIDSRTSALKEFAAQIAALGPANFLYSDGDALFAYGHRRIQAATGMIESPGLWSLTRRCRADESSADRRAGVSIDTGDQEVVLIASVPLTDEAWQPLAEGELVAVRHGRFLNIGKH